MKIKEIEGKGFANEDGDARETQKKSFKSPGNENDEASEKAPVCIKSVIGSFL